MKPGGKQLWLLLAAMFALIAVKENRAQQIPLGHATSFSSDMYFDAPFEEKVQMKLSGAEAAPLPGGLLDVKQFRVDTFDTNGTLQVVAEAPQCTIALSDSKANSTGHLKLLSGDGRYLVEGDGFLIVWVQNAMSLTLSNRVHTVIKTGFLTP